MPSVVATTPAGRNVLSIHFDGRAKNFDLDLSGVSASADGDIDAAAWDLLEIACTVSAADGAVARGGPMRSDLGAAWRRSFEFTIPVRRLEIWSSEAMRGALVDAVAFLTDDHVSFSFTQMARVSPCPQTSLFGKEFGSPFRASEVILFSGGLDSLAGALERLASGPEQVLLVTHRSAQKAIPRQDRLGHELSRRFPRQVLHAQIRATRARARTRESTQRSRSFLFAALGYVLARVFDAPRICFYENGVVSHNLPISPQVIGTMATRTTHPAALRKLAKVLDLIADHEGQPRIALANPFAWLTKTEVVSRLVNHGGAHLIRSTVSCTRLRRQSRSRTHCGACSQCIDRRFAMVAAGAVAHDPADAYLTDVFVGAREDDQSRTMALDWTRTYWKLADTDLLGFFTQFSGELTRIVAGHPELERKAAVAKAHDLQRRQSLAVRQAFSSVLAHEGQRLLEGKLPATSLLRMGTTALLGEQPVAAFSAATTNRADGTEDVPARPRPARDAGLLPLEVAFHDGPRGPEVDVRRLATLVGQQARLVHALRPAFTEDRAERTPRDAYRYTEGAQIHPAGANAAKMCAMRIRASLAKAYAEIEGARPVGPLLIQSKQRTGFRLDPTITEVATQADDG